MSRTFIVTVLACSLTTGIASPVRATAFSFSTIDFPGNVNTYLSGINASGEIIGSSLTFGVGSNAFVYDAGVFTSINVPGPIPSSANPIGINNKGQIIGSYYGLYAEGLYALYGFLDTGGSITSVNLGRSYRDYILLSGINDYGVLVGTILPYIYPVPPFNTDIYFSSSSTQYIDNPFPVDGRPTGINDAGQIIGVNYYGAYLDSVGVITPIEVAGAVYTEPTGINNLGEIVGYYRTADQREHSFVDINGVYTKFDIPGSLYTTAAAINDLGQVVGSYTADQVTHGFLATPVATTVPEPASLALFGMGVAGLGAAVCRRRWSR